MKKNTIRQKINTIEKIKTNNNRIGMASFIESIINYSHHKMRKTIMTGLFPSKISSLKDNKIFSKVRRIKTCWIALYYILRISKLAKADLLRIYQTLMRMNKSLKEFSLKLYSILLINNYKKLKALRNM